MGDLCHYCGVETFPPGSKEASRDKSRMCTADHKMPRGLGGKNDKYNKVRCCAGCNVMKANTPYDVFCFYIQHRTNEQSLGGAQAYHQFCFDLMRAGLRSAQALATVDIRTRRAIEHAAKPKAPAIALQSSRYTAAMLRAENRRARNSTM